MEPISLEAQLLLKFQAHIALTVPEIRYVNQDLQQLEIYTLDVPSVSWPCCLIDMSNINFSDLHGGVQEGLATIVFRLGFNPFSQTSNLQPEAVKLKGMNYYEIENKFYVAMQGFHADGLIQPMTRVSIATERREEDAFRVRAMSFTTYFEDHSAKPKRNQVTRPPISWEFL